MIDENYTLTYWDFRFLYFFILITGFVDIITLVELLGRSTFSGPAKVGLSIATLLIAVTICYFGLRKAGIFSLFKKKENIQTHKRLMK